MKQEEALKEIDNILQEYLKCNARFKIGDCIGDEGNNMIIDSVGVEYLYEEIYIYYYGCRPKGNFHIGKRRIWRMGDECEYVNLIKSKEEIELLHNKK